MLHIILETMLFSVEAICMKRFLPIQLLCALSLSISLAHGMESLDTKLALVRKKEKQDGQELTLGNLCRDGIDRIVKLRHPKGHYLEGKHVLEGEDIYNLGGANRWLAHNLVHNYDFIKYMVDERLSFSYFPEKTPAYLQENYHFRNICEGKKYNYKAEYEDNDLRMKDLDALCQQTNLINFNSCGCAPEGHDIKTSRIPLLVALEKNDTRLIDFLLARVNVTLDPKTTCSALTASTIPSAILRSASNKSLLERVRLIKRVYRKSRSKPVFLETDLHDAIGVLKRAECVNNTTDSDAIRLLIALGCPVNSKVGSYTPLKKFIGQSSLDNTVSGSSFMKIVTVLLDGGATMQPDYFNECGVPKVRILRTVCNDHKKFMEAKEEEKQSENSNKK
jgi:hypothetical protein